MKIEATGESGEVQFHARQFTTLRERCIFANYRERSIGIEKFKMPFPFLLSLLGCTSTAYGMHTAVSITLPPLPTSALPLRFSIRSSFHTTVHICSSKLQSPCATVTTPVEYCIFPNSSTAGEKKGGDREFHSRFSETSKRDVGGYGIETNWLVGSIVRSRGIFYFLPSAAWKHNNFPFVTY